MLNEWLQHIKVWLRNTKKWVLEGLVLEVSMHSIGTYKLLALPLDIDYALEYLALW